MFYWGGQFYFTVWGLVLEVLAIAIICVLLLVLEKLIHKQRWQCMCGHFNRGGRGKCKGCGLPKSMSYEEGER